ncbi:peptidylprolyl isomerase [Myxococcota bacterium]|nr:peptidylprolyl isomerase [Myxococcota bacterium]
MLRFLRRGQRWLTAVIVIGIGGVFVFFMGLGGPLERAGASGTWIRVGPYSFGPREFELARMDREQQMREALGENFDQRAMRDTIDQMTTNLLVERAVLAAEAEEQGLTVGNGEIERTVLNASGFRGEDGRFDPDLYRGWVQQNYGNERTFLQEQRIRMLAGKMLRIMRDNAAVSEAEARASLEQRLEEVRIAFVALGTDEVDEGFEADPEAITSFLEIREGEARDLYAERSETYNVPEQIRARHILVRVEPDASDDDVASAQEKAEGLAARIEAGEDFADLAREVSDDTGSASEGGDLGFFPRGRMVAPFEDAAFALEVDETSPPVRSDFGFHIIRNEERQPAQSRSFEEVQEELAAELLGRDAARQRARERSERLSTAVAGGTGLEVAVRGEELTLERSGLLRRRPDGFIPGLGSATELLAAAFALEPGEASPRVFEVKDQLVLMESIERVAADPAEVDAGWEAEQSRLLGTKRNAQVSAWLESRRKALTDSGDLFVDFAVIGNVR